HQRQRLRTLTSSRRDSLPHRFRHIMGFIDDHQRRIPPMQRTRVSRQRHQSGIILRKINLVRIHMDPVRQLFIEFNHPLRQPERNIRLPLIRRHHQRLRRRWTNKQLSNPQHGRKRRLTLTPRHRPDSLSNPWRERTSNKLLLRATQLHRVSSTMPTRDTQIRMNETYTTGTTIAWPTLKTKRLNLDPSFWSCHITSLLHLTRKVIQIL